MNIELIVLRTMLRLARRREPAAEEALVVRIQSGPLPEGPLPEGPLPEGPVGARGGQASIRAALRRLDSLGLVERRAGQAPRLTMAGLAVAVGLLPTGQRKVLRDRSPRSRAA
jgi:hypothetical protein